MEIKLREKLSGSVLLPEDFNPGKIFYGDIVCCPPRSFPLSGWKLPPPPENLLILTAEDLEPGNTIIYPDGAIPLLGGKQPVFPGQPLALLCSPDRNILTNYMETCEASFVTVKQVKTPVLKGENVFASRSYSHGNPDAVFKKKKKIWGKEIEIPESRFISNQPWSAFCHKDGEIYTVHTASHWPYSIQSNGARILGVKKERIIVENSPADYFNQNRIYMPTLYSCFSLILSSRTGESVMVAPGLSGNKENTPPSGHFCFNFRIALNEDETIEALAVEIKYLAGAFPLFAAETIDRICLILKNQYSIPHISIKARAIQSISSPCDGGPGFGSAVAGLAFDLFLGSLKNEIDVCPLAWRKQLLNPASGKNEKAGKFIPADPRISLMDRIAEASGFVRKSGAYSHANRTYSKYNSSAKLLRGIGLSSGFVGSNFIRKWPDLTAMTATIILDKEGKLFIKPSCQPCHTELVELWRKMAATTLSIDRENVFFLQNPFNGTGILSRNVTLMTDLIRKGLSAIQNKRFRQTLPIEITKSISGKDLKGYKTETLEGNPFSGISYASSAIEILMHRGEGIPEIKKIWLYISCGMLLDKEIARSILEAEISQAIAWCRYRDVDGYHTGQLFKGGTPPQVEIYFDEKDDEPGGIEGLAFATIPLAFMQAVNTTLMNPLTAIPLNRRDIRKGLSYAD